MTTGAPLTHAYHAPVALPDWPDPGEAPEDAGSAPSGLRPDRTAPTASARTPVQAAVATAGAETPRPLPERQAASCTGKAPHSFKMATTLARRMRRTRDARLAHYHCPFCGWWHVGERLLW